MPAVTLTERTVKGDDSITITLHYVLETYADDTLVSRQPYDFKQLHLCWNSPRHYYTIVHSPIRRVCAFGPRVKRQLVVDERNIIRLPRAKLDWLGIGTYGFTVPVRLPVTHSSSNYFEVMIVQPVDQERTPRDKLVIIKGKRAYYYERDGKVDRSILADPLKKSTSGPLNFSARSSFLN
jgi:hypothetical protein